MTRGGGLRTSAALVAILLAGAAIHLPFLGAASLWMDEAFTVLPALEADGIASLFSLVRAFDTQPPLSHLAIYALRDLLPAGEFGLRLPNFIALQAGLVFLFLAIRRVWGAPTALLAAGLAQIAPYLAFYGAEARNYGLWFVMVCASWWLLLRWTGAGAGGSATEERGRAFLAVAWGVVNGAGLLVHLFHLFALVSQWAALAVLARAAPGPARRRLLRRGAAGSVLALLMVTPWAVGLAAQAADGTVGVNWTRPPSVKNLMALPYALVVGFSWGPGLREAHTLDAAGLLRQHGLSLAVAALLLACLAIAAAQLMVRGRRRGDAEGAGSAGGPGGDGGIAADRIALLLVPATGAAGPILYALVAHFPLHPRHLMFLAPCVALLLARLLLSPGPGRWAAAAVVALQAASLVNLHGDPACAKDDERGAVRHAEAGSAGPACIIGDVAPLYTVRATGLIEQFTDLSDPALCAGISDLWWVENRPWEDPERRIRRKVERAARQRGLVSMGTENGFRGLTLHHWGSAAGESP